MLIRLVALWATGVVVAVPFVAWWARDTGRIPGRIWYWSGYDRRAWQWGVYLGFVAGGVIAIITVVRWRRSTARAELLDDLRERIAAHAARVADDARRAAELRAEQESRILREAESIDLREDPGHEDTNVRVLHDEPRPLRVVPSTDDVTVRRGVR